MRYDISNQKAPEMPNLGKGTECIKFLLTQASKDMHEPLVPMLFPSLGAHISGAEFQYPDRSWKETCGMMAQLVGNSGDNKGQLTDLVKAICRDFTRHDEAEYKKLEEWSNLYQAKKNAKDTPVCPTIAIWFPPVDTTKPAFLKNAIALEKLGGRTQYFDLPEVEMADQLCGSHKQVSKTFRITFSSETGLYTKTNEYLPRFRFPSGSQCGIYNLLVLNRLKPGDELWITEGASDCWAMLSAGHKAIAIPSATLLAKKDVELLKHIGDSPSVIRSAAHSGDSPRAIQFHMYPDRDAPGERLFLQLQKVLPSLQHHQLPPGCKDFSDYFLTFYRH